MSIVDDYEQLATPWLSVASTVRAAGAVVDEVLLRTSTAGEGSPDRDRRWVLEPQDEGVPGIAGQFRPEALRITYAAELGEAVPQNSDEAVQNYIKGRVDLIGFEATIYSDVGAAPPPGGATVHAGDPRWPSRALAAFRAAVKKDRKLQRPPIYLFTAGAEISILVLVETVAVTSMELRKDGTLRGFKATVDLKHYDPIDRSDLRALERVEPVPVITVPAGVDWELLGYLEYGIEGVGQVLEDYNFQFAKTADGAPLFTGAEIGRQSDDQVRAAVAAGRNYSPLSDALGAAGATASFGLELLGK